jgi:SnoaL-like polyketide cyclase
MPTAQATSNKATFSRFHDAVNTGDAEVISKTIDEVVDPKVLFHAPVPTAATGAQALKHVWAVLLRTFPDLHVAVEDVIAGGTRSSTGTRSPGPTRASTGASHQPANPSRTTRSSSPASPAAESLRSGGSSTSSHRCDNSAPFRPSYR